jgi:3-phenylpropionate/trans-cinnamate dioxygenase ferredoxin component
MPDDANYVFVPAAKTSDVAPGTAIKLAVGDCDIALFNLGGTFYATDESCTHAYASLVDGYIDGDEVECPLHGARFSIPTGEVLAEPATESLATYPVRVEADVILIGIPAR